MNQICEIIVERSSTKTCIERCDRISDMCIPCRIKQAKTWVKPYWCDNMTRCNLLNTWFDTKSKELDEAENQQGKDLITGEKKWLGKIY